LARLRAESADEDGQPQQRTSVMTHIAWVPPEWLDAAERVLDGLRGRHPSRTVILVPRPGGVGGVDAEVSVRTVSGGPRCRGGGAVRRPRSCYRSGSLTCRCSCAGAVSLRSARRSGSSLSALPTG